MNVGNSLKTLLTRLHQQEEEKAKDRDTKTEEVGKTLFISNGLVIDTCHLHADDGGIKLGTKCTNYGCNEVCNNESSWWFVSKSLRLCKKA